MEQKMKAVYESPSEKDRRIYAAIEAKKLPRGGITYIAKILGCAGKTIRQGIKELKETTKNKATKGSSNNKEVKYHIFSYNSSLP